MGLEGLWALVGCGHGGRLTAGPGLVACWPWQRMPVCFQPARSTLPLPGRSPDEARAVPGQRRCVRDCSVRHAAGQQREVDMGGALVGALDVPHCVQSCCLGAGRDGPYLLSSSAALVLFACRLKAACRRAWRTLLIVWSLTTGPHDSCEMPRCETTSKTSGSPRTSTTWAHSSAFTRWVWKRAPSV